MDYLQSDEYVEYLKKNCGVRGFDYTEKSPNFVGAGVDVFLNHIKLLNIQETDNVLEIGCGLGRLLKEMYDTYHCKLYGIDNNSKIIDLAKIRVGNICQEVKSSSAEKIDYPDDYFDKIFCWGVFELCDQEKSFLEMCSCLKVGGMLLLTGKSHTYYDDDIEAYAAEVAVTEKNIKHTFTDYSEMKRIALGLGMRLVSERFFERRGYFMNNKYKESNARNFYEWLVIFKKDIHSDEIDSSMKSFSTKHSTTYTRKQNLM